MISDDQRSSDSVIAHLSVFFLDWNELVGWLHVKKWGMLLINNDQGFLPIFFANPIFFINPGPVYTLLIIWLRNKRGREFLAHLSRRLMGELIVYQSLRRPSSVRPQFQTSSPLKPLGQLNSNYIWRLLRTRERKFVQMVLVTWPRWPPRPYMVKTL